MKRGVKLLARAVNFAVNHRYNRASSLQQAELIYEYLDEQGYRIAKKKK